MSKIFTSFISLAALAAILVFTKYWQSKEDIEVVNVRCNFSQNGCEHFVDGHKLVISIAPLPIAALNQVEISLSNIDLAAQEQRLWFEGRYMEMGQHLLLPAKGKELSWNGSIPICSVDPQMAWDLRLSLTINGSSTELVVNVPTVAP